MSSAARAQLVSIYRSVWRESSRCSDYNTRHFIRRKLRESYRGGAATSGLPEGLDAAETQLAEVRRLVDLTNMYRSDPVVLEKLNK